MSLPNSFDFDVRDGRVHVTRFSQYESRGDCCLEMLCDLVVNWPELFEGLGGSVFYGDRPPDIELPDGRLGFCTTVQPTDPGPWLPFPCFSFLRYPEIGIHDSDAMAGAMLANGQPCESEKIFWLGTDTHPSRRRLCELGRENPAEMDVALMEWDRSDPRRLVSKTRLVSIPDHGKYKYLVDCPGIGYSLRLKWLLATGRPVFRVSREIREPWELEMEPWVHFIPVADDLSDLLENHARLEGDPDLYQSIGRNARKFAAENLTMEGLLHRTAEAVWQCTQALHPAPREIMEKSANPERPISLVAVYSDNIEPLYENFVASLDPETHGLRLVAERVDLSGFHEFGFQTESWYRMILAQVELVLRVMEREIQDGEYFIASDVDLHFFKPERLRNLVKDASHAEVDFSALLDRENHYNSGFIILRKCREIRELYERVRQGLVTRRLDLADQDEINLLIPELRIKHHPICQKTGVLGLQAVHEETVFYHATAAINLEQKLTRIAFAKNQMGTRDFGVPQSLFQA